MLSSFPEKNFTIELSSLSRQVQISGISFTPRINIDEKNFDILNLHNFLKKEKQ